MRVVRELTESRSKLVAGKSVMAEKFAELQAEYLKVRLLWHAKHLKAGCLQRSRSLAGRQQVLTAVVAVSACQRRRLASALLIEKTASIACLLHALNMQQTHQHCWDSTAWRASVLHRHTASSFCRCCASRT